MQLWEKCHLRTFFHVVLPPINSEEQCVVVLRVGCAIMVAARVAFIG